MNLVLQHPHAEACQHACVAMVAGVTLKDVIRVVGHERRLGIDERIRALAHFGIEHTAESFMVGVFAATNDNCLGYLIRNHRTLWCSVYSIVDGNYGHAVLIHDQQLYDPWHGLNPQWPWHRMIGSAAPIRSKVSLP